MSALAFQSSVYPNDSNIFAGNDDVETSAVFNTNRVCVYSPNSDWAVTLQDRFNELTRLPIGWDGYAGQPVSLDCAHFAFQLLDSLCMIGVPAPSIVPGSDGTMQMEWHRSQYDIEIEIFGPYDILASRFDHVTGALEEEEFHTNLAQIFSWIGDLKRREELALVG